jgi:hypothetical protein
MYNIFVSTTVQYLLQYHNSLNYLDLCHVRVVHNSRPWGRFPTSRRIITLIFRCVYMCKHGTSQCIHVQAWHFPVCTRASVVLPSVYTCKRGTSQCIHVQAWHFPVYTHASMALPSVHTCKYGTSQCIHVQAWHSPPKFKYPSPRASVWFLPPLKRIVSF